MDALTLVGFSLVFAALLTVVAIFVNDRVAS
jgi:hypothetical protein